MRNDLAYRSLRLGRLGAMRAGGVLPPVTAPFQSANTDGWSVTASNPAAAVGQTFSVTRQGFNAAGAPAAVADTLALMIRLRQPFPSEASLTADRVTLSNFIYVGDAVAGAINSSLLEYPLPIAHWLRRDKEIIEGSTYTARLAVAHAYARNGRPVAAVKFTASDGVTTVETLVTALSTIVYTASGFTVPHFAGNLDLSGFANGAVLTIDAIIYPWVGAAFTISLHADAYPSPNLTTLRVLCNRTGAYGKAYAYVNAAGPGGTPTVSTNPATAEANPYGTLDAAATALKAFNNTTFARNFCDGGVIRLLEGLHIFSNPIRTPGQTQTWPVVVEAANPAARATTILRDRGTTMQSSLPDHCVFRNITIQRSVTGSFVAYDNVAANLTYTALVAFEGCSFDANGAGNYSGYIYRTGNGYFIDCVQLSDVGQSARLATVNKTVKNIGCNGTFARGSTTYASIGSRLTTIVGAIDAPAAVAGCPAGVGCGAFFSHVTITVDGASALSLSAVVGARGFAAIGSVFEATAGATASVMYLNADNNVQEVQNVLVMCCTGVGARMNYLYQDTGIVTVAKRGFLRFTVAPSRNTKTDVFGANANLIGNWPAAFNVGSRGNSWLTGSDQNDTHGAGVWVGEVLGSGEVSGTSAAPLNPAWVADRSFSGTGAGGGDYTPGPASQLPTLTAAQAPHSHDMLGRAILEGARVGALQAA